MSNRGKSPIGTDTDNSDANFAACGHGALPYLFVVPARAGTVHGNSDRDAGRRISASAASAPARSRRWTPRFHSALDNAFYVIDSNTVELGYFCLRHSIARQGSNAAELGGRYLACL